MNDILSPQPASPGLQPSDTLAEAGKKTWSFQFSEMLSHEEGTRLGEDIEALHDMRVATRRLRAAFDVFGEAFSPKTLKPHLIGLRATGRALGKVRDLDVFMEKAHHYLDQLPELNRHELDPLLESWMNQRENSRQEMLVYLDSDQYTKFKDSFSTFLAKPERQDILGKEGIPVPHQIQHLAPELIYRHYGEARSFESILENASISQHHALRIQFKKFRYTVEFFKEVLGPEAQPVIDDLKKIQDHLGDLNDADVAAKLLEDQLKLLEKRQDKFPVIQRINTGGIMRYLTHRLSERHQLLLTFPDLWKWFNRDKFRQNLASAISVL
jgi:CHAD domain-containing protein